MWCLLNETDINCVYNTVQYENALRIGEPRMKTKKTLAYTVNILILIFGILCIWYYIGMGLAVRFGQSLLWLWAVVGAACIARFALVQRALAAGKPLPIPAKLIRAWRIALAVFMAVFIAVECVICSAAADVPQQGLDCIIVLGAKVNGTQPSGALTQRIRAAAEYLHENPGTLCIASGGQGADEGISEAACIARDLAAYGIDPARIVLEDKSTDTLTNIENSLALMPAGTARVGIVTNDFHIFRALAIARHVSSLDFSGIPARSSVYGFIHYAMREFFAVGVGLMKGELSF